ncbi:hypothetical protein NTGHW29_210020 [Candidatus Nitrotoga sp. HW29]|nr:hypothetical protein NTGHW29_210020 [Candidatus Nitrotoga sp. HW29]
MLLEFSMITDFGNHLELQFGLLWSKLFQITIDVLNLFNEDHGKASLFRSLH